MTDSAKGTKMGVLVKPAAIRQPNKRITPVIIGLSYMQINMVLYTGELFNSLRCLQQNLPLHISLINFSHKYM
jgi:hypothetical protein